MLMFERNTANEIWTDIYDYFKGKGNSQIQQSRSGITLELLHVGITIQDPRQRWVISRFPPINPAFAIAEIVWIMNGRNDSSYLNYWNNRLPKYAGNGKSFHGAYGYRLRKIFGVDQLKSASEVLRKNKVSRQVVLQIWDPVLDLPYGNGNPKSKDIPCNVSSILKVRDNKLEWLQVLRSNDLFLGLPYNIIQFTTMQEILAGWIGVEVGTYNHVSDSMHIYEHDLSVVQKNKDVIQICNNDSLICPFNKSQKNFTYLDNTIDCLTKNKVTIKVLRELSNWKNASQAYKNLLYVLLAESARRSNITAFSGEIMQKCTNPVLNCAWDNWFKHTIMKSSEAKHKADNCRL